MFRLLGRQTIASLTFVVNALMGPVGVLAQTETGNVSGRVVDESGGVIPGVIITITNLATSQLRTTVTNEEGLYRFAALQPSQYSVRAEVGGFAPVIRGEVTVNVGSFLDVNFELVLAGVQEAITVSGEGLIVESTKTEFSRVITTQVLDNIPSKSRQYLDMVLLLPATVNNVSTTGQGAGLNIGGARSKETSLLVDGFYNMDEGFGHPRQRHSQDSIQEFQVVLFGGTAEHGRAIGGTVNAITKSGGNTFNGSVYGFFRDETLNSQPPAQQRRGIPEAEFERQQWGGVLGGPIKRDKSFFFGAYERVSEKTPFDNGITEANGALLGLPPEDVGTINGFYNLNFAMGKWDYNLNENHRFQVNFAMSQWAEYAISPVFFATRSVQQQQKAVDLSFMFKWTGTSSDGRILHDLKGSYFPRFWENAGRAEGGPPLALDGEINVETNNSSPPRVVIPSVATFGSPQFVSYIDTHPVQLIYSMSSFTDRHSFKFGADYMTALNDQDFVSQLVGVYSFSSLDSFRAGQYTTFNQGFGNTENPRWHQYVSAYAQDSWRMNDRVTMNYGLRYDLEIHPRHPGTGQRLGTDYSGLGPRFALSYDLNGQGTTFLKFSSGIYVDRLYQRLTTPYPQVKGYEQIRNATWRPQTPGAPTYPDVFLETPVNLPSAGVINAWLLPDELKTPRTGQLVGTFEHALTPSLSVSASGIYTRSWDKEHTWDANLDFDSNQQRWFRPDPGYRNIRQYRFDGKAEYLGGTFEVTKRGNRLGFSANTTIARSYDSGDHGDFFPRDQRVGIEGDWGPTIDTPTVRAVASGWYNVTSAMQLSGVFRTRTGIALSALAPGHDLNGDGNFGSCVLCVGAGDPTPTFDRNTFRGPSVSSLDVRLTWAPAISDARLHFYVECFNLLNQESPLAINNDYGPDPANPKPVWMTPLSYFPPREVQVGARFSF